MISNKTGLQYIAELFIREGIQNIVISPGSRNAPMILTFPEYKELNCYSIVDERSAGFFALGLAQRTRKPVVLNCTSGSALLNYAPALAEAYYHNIPLIVLSADRPAHLIDAGDGQAIQQENIYQNYIRKSVHLAENPISETALKKYQQLVLEAISASISPASGPVHINVPLDEPIYGLQEKEQLNLLASNPIESVNNLTDDKFSDLSKIWEASKKKLILVGQNPVDERLNDVLIELSEQDDVAIMCETTSNISGDNFINHIDQCLTQVNEQNESGFFPDLLISIGGHIVSKKIKAWLRNKVDYQHWHITPDHQAMNTFYHLTEHIQYNATDFLTSISARPTNKKGIYSQLWNTVSNKAKQLHKEHLKNIPYSDLMVFESIRKNLPKESLNLHFANSTPIRYSQFFEFAPNIVIDSNRGVSGIDGSTSTALGASLINKEPTCLITGDLSFFYDSNALWNQYLHPNFKIIVINNNGGGIFRFIEGPAQSEHLPYFETPHQRSAQSLAIEAGMEYSSCSKEENLNEAIQQFFQKNNHAKLLEVFTPAAINDVVLKAYFSFLRNTK